MTTSDDPQRLTGLKVFVSYPRGGSAHTCAEKVQRTGMSLNPFDIRACVRTVIHNETDLDAPS